MARYLLSICYSAGATPPSAEELEVIMADVGEVRRRLQEEGSWVFGGGLDYPSAATVITSSDGSTLATGGPFIDTKEVIGGISIIDVADTEAAVMWAERTAQATRCPIELRPFVDDHLE